MAPDDRTLLLVTTDAEVAELFKSGIGAPDELDVLAKRGLDGGVTEWLVVVALATPAVRLAVTTALRYLELTRVSLIRIGDVEIVNPRNKDVDRLITAAERSLPAEVVPQVDAAEPE
jgi:virulence-associated protein VagC